MKEGTGTLLEKSACPRIQTDLNEDDIKALRNGLNM